MQVVRTETDGDDFVLVGLRIEDRQETAALGLGRKQLGVRAEVPVAAERMIRAVRRAGIAHPIAALVIHDGRVVVHVLIPLAVHTRQLMHRGFAGVGIKRHHLAGVVLDAVHGTTRVDGRIAFVGGA